MIISNLDYVLKDYDGSSLKSFDGQKELTFREAIKLPLFRASKSEQEGFDIIKQMKCFDLYMKVTKSQMSLSLTDEEVAIIKEALSNAYKIPGITGQIMYILKGKGEEL